MRYIAIVISIASILISPQLMAHPGSGDADKPPLSELYATKIVVSDLEANLRFYVEGLGLKKAYTYKTSQVTEVILQQSDGRPGVLMLVSDPSQDRVAVGSAYGPLVFQTRDVDALFAKLKAIGADVVKEPGDGSAKVKTGFVKDPDGRSIEIFQPQAKP